jgi:hypothetical protein
MSSPEIIELDGSAIQPFKYEISQNSKGYCQMKVTVRTDKPLSTEGEYKALREQFGKAFVAMQSVILSEDLKVQPDNDPIDQKHWNIVISDLEQQEAEMIKTMLQAWTEEEDSPPIADCIDIIPPRVKKR